MSMVGDGPEGQPTEGVASLDSIAGLMADGGETEDALEVSDESEVSDADEGEEVEAEDADEADGADDSEDAEEPVFTIKVDGKEITLKQSELIEQAQKGFDYSQKTMKVAEERKAVEAERATVSQVRQEVERAREAEFQRLQALEGFLAEEIGAPPPIEWAQQDAAYYLAQKELYESRKGKLEQVRQSIEHLHAERQHYRQAYLRQKAEDAERALQGTIPGWNEQLMSELAQTLTASGITPETADAGFFEPGLWQLAHKAREYDRIMAKKAEAKPVVNAAPKVGKPTAQNQPAALARRQEAMKAYKKNPSIDRLAALGV